MEAPAQTTLPTDKLPPPPKRNGVRKALTAPTKGKKVKKPVGMSQVMWVVVSAVKQGRHPTAREFALATKAKNPSPSPSPSPPPRGLPVPSLVSPPALRQTHSSVSDISFHMATPGVTVESFIARTPSYSAKY